MNINLKWLMEKYPDKVTRAEDRKNHVIVYMDTKPFRYNLRIRINK